MNRIRESGWTTAISTARGLLPGSLGDRLRHAEFACGIDPAYVGLYDGDLGTPAEGYMRGGICIYPHNQTCLPKDRRQTTIVLADGLYDREKVPTIIHEFGHVLHETIDWGRGLPHGTAPISRYGEEDYCEAFAEAFRLWVLGYGLLADHFAGDDMHLPLYISPDDGTVALFERLAA